MTAAEPTSCPQCQALLVPGDRACAACGADLAPRPARRQGSDAKAQARAEFARKKRVLSSLRALYGVSAASMLLPPGFMLLALAGGARLESAPPFIAVMVACAIAMALGAVRLAHNPGRWSMMLAITGTAYLGVVVYGVGIGWQLFFPVLFTLFCWFAVPVAARLQRLAQEHAELKLVRQRIDPQRLHEGGVADTARERRHHSKEKGWNRLLLIGGISVVGFAAAIFLIFQATRAESLDGAARRFRSTWEAHRLDGFTPLCATASLGVDLRSGLSRRGFADIPIPLGPATIDSRGDIVTFMLGGEELRTRWGLDPSTRHWVLLAFRLPPLQAPDAHPFVETFRTAWRTPGTDAILATLQESLRSSRGRTLLSVLKGRDWLDQRPELGAVDVTDKGDGQGRAVFALQSGELTLQLHYNYPQWWVSGLQFPRDD